MSKKDPGVDLICTLFALGVVVLNVIVKIIDVVIKLIVLLINYIKETIKNRNNNLQESFNQSEKNGVIIQEPFDNEAFKKYFKEYYPKTHYHIISTLKLATAKTFYKIIKNAIPTLKEVNVTEIIYNQYKYTHSLTLENLQKYGLPVNPIRIELIFEKPIEISHIEIKSELFKKYSNSYKNIYNFSHNKNFKKYFLTATNVQYSSELFNVVFDFENCNCERLEPFLHGDTYPAFYLCPNCGKLYMCECQRQYYEELFYKYFKGVGINEKYKIYIENYETDGIDLFKDAIYKNGICDLCRNQIPQTKYKGTGTDLELIYKPYIDTLYDYYRYRDNITNELELKELRIKARDEIVADRAGFYNKGEKWINETILYKTCCQLFPDYKIIRQYSPEWLGKQRIDIYIKELNIAIEYQGEQHYKPIDIFGGEEGFIECQKRDKLKKALCEANGVKLIYFKYDEKLTEENILNKIKNYQ